MKNKKETDAKNRKEHLAQKNAAKARKRGTPNLNRDEEVIIKPEKKSFLIISEGENTERTYFEQFLSIGSFYILKTIKVAQCPELIITTKLTAI